MDQVGEDPRLPVRQERQGRVRHVQEDRLPANLHAHADDPRVRVDALFDQDHERLQRPRVQQPRPRPPFDGPGGLVGRPGVPPDPGRLHLWLAPQPRRDSRKGPLRDPQARRRLPARDHGELPRRRDIPRRGAGEPRTRPRRQATCRRVPRVRRAGGDFREGDGLPQRPRRLDARLLPALRHLPQQRDRRRLRLHLGRRRALQEDQPQARRRRLQHRRWRDGPRPRLGRHGPGGDGPVPHALGGRHEGGTADPLQRHEQPVRHGRPDARRDDGLRVPRAHRRRREPRADARRARRRLQPARRDRGHGPQKSRSSAKERPVLLDHQPSPTAIRPFPYRRRLLPHQRGEGALAAGGFDRRVSAASLVEDKARQGRRTSPRPTSPSCAPSRTPSVWP